MRPSITLTSAVIVSLAQAATLVVDVGLNGLSFTPNTTTAAAGDVVEFHFHPKQHNVVQTSFAAPCNSSAFANPFYSGFVPVSAGEASTVFRLTVNDTKPIWYYCGQVTHCQSGMVGVINGPSTGNTLDVFKANAAKTSSSTNPNAVNGGILAAGSGNSTAGATGSAGAGGAATTSGKGSGGGATASGKGSGGASNTASGTASGSSTATGSAAASTSSSAGEALRALRWNELLGMGIAVGGAVVLVQ